MNLLSKLFKKKEVVNVNCIAITDIDYIFCVECGVHNELSNDICIECGTKLQQTTDDYCCLCGCEQ